MLNDYLEAARLLREKKQSFVLATVVRTGGHTSAKSGAKAIVTEDGSLVGWVGGSCAEPTVVRESRNALRDGQPRLIRLSPPEELGKGPQEGVVEVALTCVSGGTLEIYIEPHLPRPHLVAVGHLPITEVLVNLGKDMGYEVTVMSPQVDATKFPRADRVVADLDFSKLDIRRDTAIVVASHANYDEEALQAALATQAAYVSLVASRRRAADVIQYLRQARVPEEQLGRLKNPAGIDLGGSASLNAAGPHPIPPLSAPSL
ncbi:MAG: XdhC family protein, partial [Vicinamibacteria bacterium]